MKKNRCSIASLLLVGLCVSVTTASPASDYVETIRRTDAVAYFRLEEADTTTVDSMNGIEGTYFGPTPGVAGLRPGDLIAGREVILMPADNNAGEFTNSNGVVGATDPMLDAPENGSFSTELLFKPASEGPGPFGELISKGNCCAGLPSYYLLHWGPGNGDLVGKLRWGVNALGPPHAIDSAEPIPYDEWSHIATSYNVESGEAVLYINGEVSNAAILPDPVNPSPGDPWLIGGLQMGPADSNFINQATGILDEVSFYGRVLSPLEIAEHFEALFSIRDDGFGLRAGDANGDFSVDTADVVQILAAAKFETGQLASFSEGDFSGDRVFNTADIVAMLAEGLFETGPYAAVSADASTASVPEPSSVLLAIAAFAAVMAVGGRRWRRIG